MSEKKYQEDFEEKTEVKNQGLDNSDPKENTRSQIAKIYVWAYFCVIAAVFVIGFFCRFQVTDYKDMLIAVSGVLSGPLGFIVGYYFKASKE
jgi:hypothetical protein